MHIETELNGLSHFEKSGDNVINPDVIEFEGVDSERHTTFRIALNDEDAQWLYRNLKETYGGK